MDNTSVDIPNDAPGQRPLVGAVIRYSIVIAFITVCGWYVLANREDFAFLAAVSPTVVAWAGALMLLSFIISAYQLRLFLRKFGVSPGAVEVTALTMAMILGNLVTPMRAGTGGLAVYLKRIHGLDFSSFAVIYGGTAVLAALINAGLGLVGLVLLWMLHGFVHVPLGILVAGLFFGCLWISVAPPSVRWWGRWVPRPIVDAADSWRLLTKDRRLLFKLALTFLAITVALVGSLDLVYQSIGAPVPWLGVLVTTALGAIANLVPITPGSLGIYDAVVIQIPQFFGLDPARAVAGALVVRALSFFLAVVFGAPGMVWIAIAGPRQTTRSG
ncbi:MAG: flippase-like domain-containing protein [Desulfomonile sp.]|nr:flippase-like domain-containing protein [Desulfomonile sp.]